MKSIVKKIRSKAEIARAIRLQGWRDTDQNPDLLVTVQPRNTDGQ